MRIARNYFRQILSCLSILVLAGWVQALPTSTRHNISVSVGDDVTFDCGGNGQGEQWVRWDRVDINYIIAIEAHVITNDPRISVRLADNNTWVLHIKGAEKEDEGLYRCTVNAVPITSQTILLEVSEVPIPPSIVNFKPSTAIQEGSTLSLECSANGYPKPTVIWTKEDLRPINISANDSSTDKIQQTSFEGDTLKIGNVNRFDKGTYRCTASNAMAPAATETVDVDVTFKPEVQVPNPLITVPVGSEARLNCTVEASPMSMNYWTRISDDGSRNMLYVGEDYGVLENHDKYGKANITLIIRHFQPRHAGVYQCVAKNKHGETDGMVEVDGVQTGPAQTPEDEMTSQLNKEDSWRNKFTADINPKRGREDIVHDTSPPKRNNEQENLTKSQKTYYNVLTFLRLFGLLMTFH